MEDFEQRALAEATDPPRWWKRYVDDTTEYLNTIDDDIKWTTEGELHKEVEVKDMEKKAEQCLAFRDTLSVINEDGTIRTRVFRKEVMFQPAPRNAYTGPSITVKGVTLKDVESFAYLGSILSRSVRIDNEVDARIAKASTAFGRLRKKVWESNGLTTRTKLKVYKAVVLPSLLYSCETWTVYISHANTLNRFHLDCLRKILRVKWQDKIPDTEVLRLADLPSIHTILGKTQLQWSGHVSRMDDYRLPKRLFYGELSAGKRSVGGQYKRYKDTLKVTMKNFHIDPDN